jgi:hypothetical protein
MKLVEYIIDDEEQNEVYAISLVDQPAIEMDFIHFNKEEKVKYQAIDNEQRILLGPILVPDKPIYRKQGEEEWYAYMSKETVKKVAYRYLTQGYSGNTTIQHEEPVKGVYLVESWLKVGKDKSEEYGLDLPTGTWVGAFKVDNDTIWQDFIKTGEIKGFSIEGYFSRKAEELAKATIKKDKRYKKGNKIEMESYTDYPAQVTQNAKKGIELNLQVGNNCATQVGKVRARQLAKGEPISLETIKRMYSYLSRAEEDYKPEDIEACGTISYLLWGGKAGLTWSRNKLIELEVIELIEANSQELVKELTSLL